MRFLRPFSVLILACTLLLPAPLASASTEDTEGYVKFGTITYNKWRLKQRYVGISFTGTIEDATCCGGATWGATGGGMWWALGLRGKDNVQFTRQQWTTKHVSGTFPGTAGAAGDYSKWFASTTRGYGISGEKYFKGKFTW